MKGLSLGPKCLEKLEAGLAVTKDCSKMSKG